jgi:hypothetical protein
VGEPDQLEQEYDIGAAIAHEVDQMGIRLHLQADAQTHIHQRKILIQSRMNHSFGEPLYKG